MAKTYDLTEGTIFRSLIRFAVPVLLALLLQALYGAVDLWVVGQFAETADVSGVATGSLLMQTVTMVITGLVMGVTVTVGRHIGENRPEQAARAIGSGICLFGVLAAVLTVVMVFGADAIAALTHAPEEAFSQTSAYIRICGAGSVFIIAYNVLGGVFRGLGDSKTPLITVAVACVINVAGDLLFVAVFHMGAAGAALATVLSQSASVIISMMIIRKRPLPFHFSRKHIRFDKKIIGAELKIGAPVGLQELLVGLSFLLIQTIVNAIDVVASAGVGVAEKMAAFIMLAPSAYMQSMAAFVAQNMGAGKPGRANSALKYGILSSLAVGAAMAYLAFFHGDMLCSVFDNDPAVIASAHSYLKAYAIDCLMVSVLFCFAGYFNGCEKTLFVMAQGMIGAFLVRIPIAYFVSQMQGATLFHIGLATPSATAVQIVLCLIMFAHMRKRQKQSLRLGEPGKN